MADGRPEGRWNAVWNQGVPQSESLAAFLDEATGKLSSHQEDKSQVVDMLVKIGTKLTDVGATEDVVANVLREMKSYHKVTMLRCGDIAKNIMRTRIAKLERLISSSVG